MAKTKVIAIVASAALVAVLGLSACGNQASSNSSASSSSATSSSASAEPSSASAESSSSASTSASSASAEDFLVSWRGTLDDGTLVNFIVSDDGKNAGIVLTQDGAEQPKKWVGALTTAEDGTMTITDAKSKDTVSFKFGEFTKDAPVAIEVEGYGKGELKPLTAADWQVAAFIEKLGKQPGTTVNTLGMFEDGTMIVYAENLEGKEAYVAIMSPQSGEVKTLSGVATTDANGKQTFTDEATGEEFGYTWTENPEDGTLEINSDTYGKGTLVMMATSDSMTLDEFVDLLAKQK